MVAGLADARDFILASFEGAGLLLVNTKRGTVVDLQQKLYLETANLSEMAL